METTKSLCGLICPFHHISKIPGSKSSAPNFTQKISRLSFNIYIIQGIYANLS